jgi:hypothetical protein
MVCCSQMGQPVAKESRAYVAKDIHTSGKMGIATPTPLECYKN